jgi:hypothetical protein
MKYYAFAISLEGYVQDLSDPLANIGEAHDKTAELYNEYRKDCLYFRATVDANGKLDIDEVSLYELEGDGDEDEDWDDEDENLEFHDE